MKKIMKAALCVICVGLGIALLLAGSFYYTVSCKKTVRDTSVSPDGRYELTLMEIGEPAWPFGPASGRLILAEGDAQISETEFRLANDGCSISSNDWAVTWNDDHAEVILSGEEQLDEQVLLYFDGTTQRRTLTVETAPQLDIADPVQARMEQRCGEITAMYDDLYADAEKMQPQNQWDAPTLSQSSIDAIECLLIDAGLDMVDTSGAYPGYLTTADRFYDFWNDAKQGQTAEQEVLEIREEGALSYRLFVCRDGVSYVYSMIYPMDGSSDLHFEKHEVLDWELTDRGNFYYRIYPAGDKHYSDFDLIRLNAPDTELWDLNRKYIWAVGYVGTNIFLTDWRENDFGDLSFNDVWEYLYYDRYGKPFSPDGYEALPEPDCYKIPAAEFEEVVLPYFDIDLDTFRELSHYDAAGDHYPWRQIQTNDYVFLDYYTVDSEVTACRANPDGTVTLTVEMLSTDLKTDRLFAHEVTVRPLENGNFQFVGNRVTGQTEYGLPYWEPRLTWDESW